MDKKIDEIVESIFPPYVAEVGSIIHKGNKITQLGAQSSLKQALTEKKLCVPMSKIEIVEIISSNFNPEDCNWDLNAAKAIYERQFKGDE